MAERDADRFRRLCLGLPSTLKADPDELVRTSFLLVAPKTIAKQLDG